MQYLFGNYYQHLFTHLADAVVAFCNFAFIHKVHICKEGYASSFAYFPFKELRK